MPLTVASRRQTAKAVVVTPRCLVVDDDPAVREAFNLALSDDYTLYFAEDGGAALGVLGHAPIDLVILDLKLPDLDGIEILRRIRRLIPNLPVIIVTGFSSHEAAVEAANLGVAGYIKKPFDVDDMKERLECALRRSLPGRSNLELLSGQERVADVALRVIQTRYAEKLTVRTIARAVGVSPPQLRDAFQREWGLSVKDYLIRVRIVNAMTLLEETDLPIKAIASRVGYSNLANFYRHFHRMTLRTPSEFRSWASGLSAP